MNSIIEKKSEILLDVKKFSVSFQVGETKIHPVRNVDLQIRENEVIAVIGETGCGKSVFANGILRLLPANASVSGEIFLNHNNIMEYSEKQFRAIRGTKISAVPQSPVSSLDPMMKIGRQVEESLYVHGKQTKQKTISAVDQLFGRLHLGSGKKARGRYSCELSGGMCQRVLIALGVITHPRLLIVDEPTKGLDWTLRRNVIDIFSELKQEMECAMLLITHDIGVAYQLADRIAVMYCGELIELGTREDLLKRALHPYTKGLLDSMPSRGMKGMQGFSPALIDLPSGCKFHPRCAFADAKCRKTEPEFLECEPGHFVRCCSCMNAEKGKHNAVKG